MSQRTKDILGVIALVIFVVGGVWSTKQPVKSAYVYEKVVCTPSGATSTSECLSTYYENLVQTYGADVAIKDIKQRSIADPFINSICHPLMHTIGVAASLGYATVSEAFLYGDPFCWSGYYHGVMEGVVAYTGIEQVEGQVNTICANISGKESYSFDYYNCVHGLGHGISELKEHELFDALQICDSLEGNWEQQSCYGGVFMENIIYYNRSGSSKYLNADEPLYPCTSVDERYKSQCYLGQTSFALQVSGNDFKKVFEMCAGVPEQTYRNICHQSMGRDIASQANHQKEKTKLDCALALTGNDQKNCMVGAVKEIISFYHSDKEAEEYCSIQDQGLKENCFSVATEYYKTF
jgi:hypothetical protein